MIPSIESVLKQVKDLLEPWPDLKDRLDGAFLSHDRELTVQIQKAMAQIALSFYSILRVKADSLHQEPDWRANIRFIKTLERLYRNYQKVTEAIKTQDLQTFIQVIERIQDQIQHAINTMIELKKEQVDDLEAMTRKKEKIKEEMRTNKERMKEWKKWAREKANVELEDLSREELYNLLKSRYQERLKEGGKL